MLFFLLSQLFSVCEFSILLSFHLSVRLNLDLCVVKHIGVDDKHIENTMSVREKKTTPAILLKCALCFICCVFDKTRNWGRTETQ